MTFVLMLKEPGPGLCFSQTQRAPTPFVAQQPMPAGLQLGGTGIHKVVGFPPSSDSSNEVLIQTHEALERADPLVSLQQGLQHGGSW